jgi:hypothetical protein
MESKLKAKQEQGEGQKLGIASWSRRSSPASRASNRSTRTTSNSPNITTLEHRLIFYL